MPKRKVVLDTPCIEGSEGGLPRCRRAGKPRYGDGEAMWIDFDIRLCAMSLAEDEVRRCHDVKEITPTVYSKAWARAKKRIIDTHKVVPNEETLRAFMAVFADRLEKFRRRRSKYRCSPTCTRTPKHLCCHHCHAG